MTTCWPYSHRHRYDRSARLVRRRTETPYWVRVQLPDGRVGKPKVRLEAAALDI